MIQNNIQIGFTLIDLWINYMKEHEYNPEHNHGGQLSWVIFLETPDISEEQKTFTELHNQLFL